MAMPMCAAACSRRGVQPGRVALDARVEHRMLHQDAGGDVCEQHGHARPGGRTLGTGCEPLLRGHERGHVDLGHEMKVRRAARTLGEALRGDATHRAKRHEAFSACVLGHRRGRIRSSARPGCTMRVDVFLDNASTRTRAAYRTQIHAARSRGTTRERRRAHAVVVQILRRCDRIHADGLRGRGCRRGCRRRCGCR